MEAMIIAGVGLGVASAYGQVQAGKAAQRAYRMQAKQAELEGRQKALDYKDKGNQVLTQIRKALATTNARAAAGNIDPFSGTPKTIADMSLEVGFQDVMMAREGAQLAELGGIMQAGQLEMAGQQAKLQGYLGAVGTLAQTAGTAASIK